MLIRNIMHLLCRERLLAGDPFKPQELPMKNGHLFKNYSLRPKSRLTQYMVYDIVHA